MLSNAVIALKPMADGGEGTATAMIEAANGRWIPKRVIGPLAEMRVDAGFAWFADGTALVEMARASGLELLADHQLNPLKTTTFGTGELIAAAGHHGANKILLAVGGSATTDGGMGAAAALGWDFLDNSGKPVPLTGAGLDRIETIRKPPDLRLPRVDVLCDVDNPLTGEHGAARVYGPQKGATPEMVDRLDRGLAHLAKRVREQLGIEIENVPGAGAAGGLAAGAVAFMGARIVSGIETVMSRSKLAEGLSDADWVITGEGSFDRQSLYGKVVSGVLKLAKQSKTRVAVLAGQIKIPPDECCKAGIEAAIACKPDDMPLNEALEKGPDLLTEAAGRLVREYIAV
jgi:glycerate kinase